jgi:crotonobetainyl-CoA:carnitine CoA-transferase CaiB-like acyl-CoA transferase
VHQGLPHPVRLGAQRARGHQRPAYASARDAGAGPPHRLGEIVVSSTPLRLHGTDRVATRPSPTIGQHNAEIYGGWLGLSATELQELKETGAI